MENPAITAVPFELQALADAVRYQRWLRDLALPHLGKRILELGSGIGNMSQHLPIGERLILSDLDPLMVNTLNTKFCRTDEKKVSALQLQELSDPSLAQENLDTVVSFNVLEHVEDHIGLLKGAIDLLRSSRAPGPKRIVTLVPAHHWALGSIDKEFGHLRRYSRSSFSEALGLAGADPLNENNFYSRYVNFTGLLAWYFNGKILKKKHIGSSNVKAFEFLCPFIRPFEDLLQATLHLPLGNSFFNVYRVAP